MGGIQLACPVFDLVTAFLMGHGPAHAGISIASASLMTSHDVATYISIAVTSGNVLVICTGITEAGKHWNQEEACQAPVGVSEQ